MSHAFLTNPPRYFFFTGKGGVGKTTVSSATGVHLANQGNRVLLVSTDPASNIGQVFGQEIGNRIANISDVPGLAAMEIDPHQAVSDYRERIIAPMRGVASTDELAVVTEQLSGACTTEIASFNEFTSLLTDDAMMDRFDHIIFDTAPTGHTIRLLQLPGAWSDFLERGKGNANCLGPVAGLEKHKSVYAAAVSALADKTRTRLVLVARPQTSSLNEISRTHDELLQIGLAQQNVVINGVMPEHHTNDPLAIAIRSREQTALSDIPNNLASLPIDLIPLKSQNVVGVVALRHFFQEEPELENFQLSEHHPEWPNIRGLIEQLGQNDSGLVMLMGKGGVGKTAIAAAIAVSLARAGKNVHLTTTDPAAHLNATLSGKVEGLTVSRIDPEKELMRYQESVMRTRGARLSDEDRQILAEDLRSPCYEEIAVFQAFSKSIREAKRSFVIVDTAPTGHTMLLMDTTGAYHHEVTRSMGESRQFSTPLMDLQNADLTKIIITTLAETTPVLEAENLQEDLARAGIQPWAWVVNASLAAANPESQLLSQRANNELPLLREIADRHADRFAVVPMMEQAPVGESALAKLAGIELVATRQECSFPAPGHSMSE